MSENSVTRELVIRNPEGMHARPAEMFARLALRYESRIELVCRNERIDGKSILELLTTGATQGTQLTLEAEGPDAAEAVEALAKLVEGGFSSEESPPRPSG